MKFLSIPLLLPTFTLLVTLSLNTAQASVADSYASFLTQVVGHFCRNSPETSVPLQFTLELGRTETYGVSTTNSGHDDLGSQTTESQSIYEALSIDRSVDGEALLVCSEQGRADFIAQYNMENMPHLQRYTRIKFVFTSTTTPGSVTFEI